MATPKEDCERLLDATLTFAEKMLSKYGEFFPFGATMSVDGKVALVAGATDDERPASAEVISLLEGGFRADALAGKLKATALAFDVRVVPPRETEKTDAIAVKLDHRDDYSVVVCFPYVRTSSGELHVSTPFASAGANAIFK